MNVLLHSCCGPCASACVPRLKEEGHAVTMFYSNSNIDTRAEFEKRLEAAQTLAAAEGVAVADGYENEPEKGLRCERCYRYNLARTASYAAAHGFEAFTTSLTVSPHKPSAKIFASSEDPKFLREDFKKREGFKLSVRRAGELGLYRQAYCGCEFSKRTSREGLT